MTRLLDPNQLPPSLWHAVDEAVLIPQPLMAAFGALVNSEGLTHLIGIESGNDGPIGGISDDDTKVHFVNRFDGSLARVQLALLDPRDELADTSDTLVKRLSGGRTVFADTPCGAGAGFLSLLVSVATLRDAKVLPRIELNIRLVGADISPYARGLAERLLEEVRSFLEAQAIFVAADWMPWDAACDQSTTALVKHLIGASTHADRKLLVVACFSGYLIKANKLKAAEPRLYEVFKYFAGPNTAAMWIEPAWNPANQKDGLVDKLLTLAKTKWSWFASLSSGISQSRLGYSATAKFRPALNPERLAAVRVCTAPMPLGKDDD